MGIVIRRDDFEAFIPERARKVCGDAYGLAAFACFMETGAILREIDINAWVSYVFESGTRGSGTILKIFNHNTIDPVQREYMRLLSLRFEPKKEFLPLQAADILAYEIYKDAIRQQGRTQRQTRYPLRELRSTPCRWQYLGEDNLLLFAEVLSLRAKMEDEGELKPL